MTDQALKVAPGGTDNRRAAHASGRQHVVEGVSAREPDNR